MIRDTSDRSLLKRWAQHLKTLRIQRMHARMSNVSEGGGKREKMLAKKLEAAITHLKKFDWTVKP